VTVFAAEHGSLLRQRKRAHTLQALLETARFEANDDVPDERLALMFTCCHPALAEEARVALTLKVVCGLPTPAIARLFLQPEATIAQRLVRAKRKIRESGIPFAIPRGDELDARTETVLAAVYLLFTEGYSTTDGDTVVRVELCDEAVRLGTLMTQLLPTHAEARGLLALMLLHHARRRARVDAQGDIVALEDQDPRLWDQVVIERGLHELDDALLRAQPGPYQVQAAIAALHCTQRDWREIAALYDELARMQPSFAVDVAGAVAHGMANGFDEGLRRLSTLPDEPTVLAARADLLRRAHRPDAVEAYARAIAAARNERERRFLMRKRALLDP
jgi:RNA polymerase sigma-70 factor (ECF subfamily)